MDGRDRIDSDKRGEGPIEHRPIYAFPTQGVGPIQDHEQLIVFGSGLHCQRHGGDVRVGAGADILKVENQGVDPGEHPRRGPEGIGIQTVDRDRTLRRRHTGARG